MTTTTDGVKAARAPAEVTAAPVAWRYKKPICLADGAVAGYTSWIVSSSRDFLSWWPNEPLYTAGVLSADDSKAGAAAHVIGSAALLRDLVDALAARCGTNAAEWPLIERARRHLDGVSVDRHQTFQPSGTDGAPE